MPLRVMTYNILEGGIGRERVIQEVIQTVKPHLLVLQEVTDVSLLKELAESFQMQWFLGAANQKTRVALLSQLPVVSFASDHSFPIWQNVIKSEVCYQTNPSFFLLGVHLIPHLWLGFELWRYWEIRAILARAKKLVGQPLLIAGDFNAIAPGDEVRIKSTPASIKAMLLLQGNHIFRFAIQALLSAGLIDAFRFRHRNETGFTYPTSMPSTRFDYLFINPRMQAYLKDCWTVREPDIVDNASDHYPVVAEFDLDIQN